MGGFVSRALPALVGALTISVVIFLFMQNLIGADHGQDYSLPVFQDVRIVQDKPDQERLEQPELQSEAQPEEPSSEPLSLAAPAVTETAAALDLAPLDLTLPVLDVAPGRTWSAPLAAKGIALEGSGQDARGYVEVVPYNTRRPNVPEVAWRNRISGWVLVAFSVTADGKTRDVRVLDANPRGVFEETVVAAVQDWRYQVNFNRELSGDVVLTQKVDVDWKNFPQNLPNVD